MKAQKFQVQPYSLLYPETCHSLNFTDSIFGWARASLRPVAGLSLGPWALAVVPHMSMPSATTDQGFSTVGFQNFCVDGELMTQQINCFTRQH